MKDSAKERRKTDSVGVPLNISKKKFVARPYTKQELEKAKQAHRERAGKKGE